MPVDDRFPLGKGIVMHMVNAEHNLFAWVVDPVEGAVPALRRNDGPSSEIGAPHLPLKADVVIAPPDMGPDCGVGSPVLIEGEAGTGAAAGVLFDQLCAAAVIRKKFLIMLPDRLLV